MFFRNIHKSVFATKSRSYIFNLWRWMNFAVVAIDDVQIVPATKLFSSLFFKVVAIVDIQIMPAAKFKLYISNDLQLFASIFF